MDKNKILIVEDETDAANFLKIHLEKHGYEVMCAIDGKEGFEKARKDKPDLIILDLMLPKVDGYWVCNMLKSDKKFSGIPIIILTARSSDEDKSVARQCGANDYVVKPFEFEDLLARVKELIQIQ